MVEIPFDRLSADAVDRLVEEFVSRAGTDYGEVERSLESKRDQVLAQLRRGEATILFDPESESANIVLAQDVKKGADS